MSARFIFCLPGDCGAGGCGSFSSLIRRVGDFGDDCLGDDRRGDNGLGVISSLSAFSVLIFVVEFFRELFGPEAAPFEAAFSPPPFRIEPSPARFFGEGGVFFLFLSPSSLSRFTTEGLSTSMDFFGGVTPSPRSPVSSFSVLIFFVEGSRCFDGDFRLTEVVVVVIFPEIRIVAGEEDAFGGECKPLMTDLISKESVVDVWEDDDDEDSTGVKDMDLTLSNRTHR